MKLFARLLKIDQEQRIVYGRATEECVDRSDEIFDYASSKPLFEKWSASCHKDSSGKSFGNLRVMHGPTAAGRLEEIEFLDNQKAIDIAAKVVDDNEWKKVQEGVYTGFSVGGRYVRKWDDKVDGKAVKRFTAEPVEISLVDRPCVPTARFFDIIKADGSVVHKEFAQPTTATSGLADYDLEGQKKKRRMKKMVERVTLKKGIAGVAYLASMAAGLETYMNGQVAEAQREGDGSRVPDKLREAVQILSRIVSEMAIEESDELDDPQPEGMSNVPYYASDRVAELQKSITGALEKAGARNSKGDLDMIQSVHDTACKLGANCGMAKRDTTTDEDTSMKPDGSQMLKDDDVAAEGAKRGATVTEDPAQPAQSANKEKDPKKGKATGTTGVLKADEADDEDAETPAERETRLAARKAVRDAGLAKDLGILTKADIATTVVETLLALGVIAKASSPEQAQVAAQPAQMQMQKSAPALMLVDKSGGMDPLNKAAAATTTPVGRDGKPDPVAMMKMVHAAGPSFVETQY